MAWYDFLVYGDFGWTAQLIPLFLIAGVSYGISRKDKDMLFIQFPITLCVKLIFPFFETAWVLLSLALFIINIIGSHNDMLGEVKSDAERLKYTTGLAKETGRDLFVTPAKKIANLFKKNG